MTVQYYQNVLNSGPVVFFKLLLRWRGCVIKLIYFDLIIFAALYTTISCIYRFALSEAQMRSFETIILYVNNFQSMIPISFILGFYVNLVFSRFWQHFLAIPWLLKYSMTLTTFLNAQTLHAKLLRKAMVRYMNAALIITATRLHVSAKKRFPSMEMLVKAGVLTEKEGTIIESAKLVQSQPFIPVIWAIQLLTHAEREGLITNPFGYVSIVIEADTFRQGLLRLFLTDQVCVPLVYTQVITLAIYSYFLASLVGRQYIVVTSSLYKPDSPDLYVPVFTIIEFIIYMGWMKVAETLLNPMGEDDEDFDINEIIDFNWKVTMHMAEGVDVQAPPLIKDKHWMKTHVELPHTIQSMRLRSDPYMGSTYDLNVHHTTPQELRASQLSMHHKESCAGAGAINLSTLGIHDQYSGKHKGDMHRHSSSTLLQSLLRERPESVFQLDDSNNLLLDGMGAGEPLLGELASNTSPSLGLNSATTDLTRPMPPTSVLQVHPITEAIVEESEEDVAEEESGSDSNLNALTPVPKTQPSPNSSPKSSPRNNRSTHPLFNSLDLSSPTASPSTASVTFKMHDTPSTSTDEDESVDSIFKKK